MDYFEKKIKSFIMWFSREKIELFLFSLVMGFIAHILYITSNIATPDSLWNGFSYQKPTGWEISLGRWGIILVERIVNFVLIPSVITILNLIILSISVIFVCDIFNFKTKSSKILTSFAIILSPCIYITFFYMHTSLAYCFAFLFSTLSVWFLYKFKNTKLGFAISIILFAFTLSLYQSYIGVIVGIFIMYTILLIFNPNYKIKYILTNIGKSVLSIILGTILYYIITIIIFNSLDITLSSYCNADKISILNMILNLKETIYYSYLKFIDFFIHDNIFYNTNYRRDLLWIAFFIVSLIAYIIKIIKLYTEVDLPKKDKLVRMFILFIFTLFIPISLNIINIIIGFDNIYALTAVQIILFVPFLLSISEEFNIFYYLETLILIFILLTFFVAGNTSYEAMKLTYNQSIAATSRIISRIESTDGYNEGVPVVFVGIIDEENFKRTSNLYNYSLGFCSNSTVFHGNYVGSIFTWNRFLEIYFGVKYPVVSDEWYNIIINNDDFKEMNIFPNDNSIKMIEGAIVVKLKDI